MEEQARYGSTTAKYALKIDLNGEAYTIYLVLTDRQAEKWGETYPIQKSAGPLEDFRIKFQHKVGPKCRAIFTMLGFPMELHVLWISRKLSEMGIQKTTKEIQQMLSDRYLSAGNFFIDGLEQECLAGAMFYIFTARAEDLLDDLLSSSNVKELRNTYLQMWYYTHFLKDIEPHEERPSFVSSLENAAERQ